MTIIADGLKDVKLIRSPRNGRILPDAGGNYTYTPGIGFDGLDEFHYRLRDAGTRPPPEPAGS